MEKDKYKSISVRTSTDDELLAIAAQIADKEGTKPPSRDDVISKLIKEYKERQP